MEMSIHEIAEKVGMTNYTLRYYEKIGLLPNIKRNDKGVRIYDSQDLSGLELIRCLRNTGMPIEGIKKFIELSMQGDDTIQARKEILKKQRQKVEKQMEELKKYLDKIDCKLDCYEKLGNKKCD